MVNEHRAWSMGGKRQGMANGRFKVGDVSPGLSPEPSGSSLRLMSAAADLSLVSPCFHTNGTCVPRRCKKTSSSGNRVSIRLC